MLGVVAQGLLARSVGASATPCRPGNWANRGIGEELVGDDLGFGVYDLAESCVHGLIFFAVPVEEFLVMLFGVPRVNGEVPTGVLCVAKDSGPSIARGPGSVRSREGLACWCVDSDLVVQAIREAVLFNFQVISCLKSEPETFRKAEIPLKSQRGIGGNSALSKNNLIDPTRGNTDVLCQSILADSHGLEEFLQQDLSWVNRGEVALSHPLGSLAVVVIDLNFVCVSRSPQEANPPLIVDPNAVLPSSVTGKLLEAISWRHPQVNKNSSNIEQFEFPTCVSLNFGRQFSRGLPVKDSLVSQSAKLPITFTIKRMAIIPSSVIRWVMVGESLG